MDKYIGVYNSQADVNAAVDNQELLHPYLAYIPPSTVDYNSYSGGGHDYSQDYFTIESLEDYNSIRVNAPSTLGLDPGMWISLDGGTTWMDAKYQISTALNSGETLLIKADATMVNLPQPIVTISGAFNVKGNIMSLVYKDNFTGQTAMTKNAQFNSLLRETNVVSTENLVLPATTLAESCYEKMFSGCTSLTTAPSVLPALDCPQRGYNDMFINCTSLVTAPAIMATGTTGAYSMAGMFLGCTSLVNVPDMHLMTFGWLSTCEGMFDGCTSLVKAPLLPATTLGDLCYYHMFAGCTSLSAVTCLATVINSSTSRWLENVAPTGVFTKASGATGWTIDSPDGIPDGWTVVDYTG